MDILVLKLIPEIKFLRCKTIINAVESENKQNLVFNPPLFDERQTRKKNT